MADQYYRPDNRPRIRRATRFFARPESFTLECPHCGKVYRIRAGRLYTYWDARTSRFSCTAKHGCDRIYIIGILAWPVVAATRVASQTPEDQVPHPRHLAELRKEGGGWWLGDEEGITEKRPTETNLTLEEDRPEPEEDEDDQDDEG